MAALGPDVGQTDVRIGAAVVDSNSVGLDDVSTGEAGAFEGHAAQVSCKAHLGWDDACDAAVVAQVAGQQRDSEPAAAATSAETLLSRLVARL